MAENKQNSGTENKQSAMGDKTNVPSAASTKQAKEGNAAPNNLGTRQNEQSPSNRTDTLSGDAGRVAGKEDSDKSKQATTETASQITTQAVGQVKEKAASVLGEQKTNLASGITGVADSIRQIGENIGGGDSNNQITALAGKYGDTLAGQVEKLSSYIEDKEFKELARDVEQFARRNPVLFVGAAFGLGILAARFLRSSGSDQKRVNRSGNAYLSENVSQGKSTVQPS